MLFRSKLIEVRNSADTLIYTTEKSIRDLGENIDAAMKADIEGKAEALKSVLQSEDTEAIQKSMDELAQASHKLAEKLYAQKTDAGAHGDAQQEAGQGGAKTDDEDVVDADYTEVKK